MDIVKREVPFPMRFERIGRWWNGRDEIDVVGIADGGPLLFGECKFTKKPVGLGVYYKLREKSSRLSENEKRFFKRLILIKGLSDIVG